MVQHLISPIGFPALDGVFSVRIGLVETPRQFAKRLFRRLTDSVGRRIARYMRLPPYLRQLQRREARSVELLKRWLSRDELKVRNEELFRGDRLRPEGDTGYPRKPV